jgi:hypothetical protein
LGKNKNEQKRREELYRQYEDITKTVKESTLTRQAGIEKLEKSGNMIFTDSKLTKIDEAEFEIYHDPRKYYLLVSRYQ